MSKWFEEIDSRNSNVIYSRIRLARNWDEYVFPSRMTAAQCGEMVERLREGLKDLKDPDGRELSYSQLDQMQELEKMALRERRILNMACVSRKEPSGLLLSADESGSVVLGGDDHIRMQMLAPGLKLDELWQKADVLDDYVNERFSYAFDEKYGYLTSFPTNVGTGLRACAVLHLPTLSQVRKFQSIVADKMCIRDSSGGAKVQAGWQDSVSGVYRTCHALWGRAALCHEGNRRAGQRSLQQHGGRHAGHERTRGGIQLSFHHHQPCDLCGKDQ